MAWTASAVLNQLCFFIIFSGLLALCSSILLRLLPSLRNWSQYWLALLFAAFIPLIPLSLAMDQHSIPDILLHAIHTPAQAAMNMTQPISSKHPGLTPNTNTLLLMAMFFGSVFNALRFIASARRIRQIITESQKDDTLTLLNEAQREFVRDHSVSVYITQRSISPFVWGVFRTHLVIPYSAITLPTNQRRLLVEHELTHIKRNDQHKVILTRLFASLFWFNPFIRHIEKQFVRAMELNCDGEVVDRFPHLKQDYARTLIASLRLSRPQSVVNLAAHFCSEQSSKKEYEGRIRQAMMAGTAKNYGACHKLALLACLAVMLGISLFSQAKVTSVETPLHLHNGLWPVAQAKMSSGFGVIDKIRNHKPHQGIDLAAPLGTAVVASYEGEVLIASDDTLHKNFGLVVLIGHGDAQTLYAHLNSADVNVGDRVIAGQRIGAVGITGKATGPHLHFEIIQDGRRVDPSLYLK